MSDNPYESPSADGKLSIEKTPARGAGLIRWLVVGAILMVLVSLLLPARRTATVAARRNTCTNHLKQIAFALLNYQEVYGSLPPAHTVDAAGKPLHSWRVLILPFMEEAALYDKIDLAKPWDDPANREAFETTISGYECPSTDGPPAHTTYLAVATTGGCFQPGQPR